ncbi:MAG: hypothetical protein AABZ29_00220 [Gemmatimonadota bacterium]
MIEDADLQDIWIEGEEREFRELTKELREKVETHFADIFFSDGEDDQHLRDGRLRWLSAVQQVASNLTSDAQRTALLAMWEGVLSEVEDARSSEEEERERKRAARIELLKEVLRHEGLADDLYKLVKEDLDELTTQPKPPLPWRHDISWRVTHARSEPITMAKRGLVANLLLDAHDLARDSASRTMQLMGVLVQNRQSNLTTSYLARCGRCYIHGLFPETVAMCAAACEQAVEDALPEAKRSGSASGMRAHARTLEYLSVEDVKKLEWLAEARNAVMHRTPALHDSRDDAWRSLQVLARILAKLPSSNQQ